MHSIAGIINLGQSTSSHDPRQSLRNMAASMAARTGCATPALPLTPTWNEAGELGLVDLTQANGNPRQEADSGNLLAFAGKLNNAVALRQELLALGHNLPANDDHDIILAAFRQWQIGFLTRLHGSLALALWDSQHRRLLLARDRLGIEPLYYAFIDSRLLFASQITTLLASGLIPRQLDMSGVDSFLAYGAVQEPFTLVQSIRSLPAASYLSSDQQHPGATTCYWQPKPAPADEIPSAPLAAISASLQESVRSTTVNADNAGIFLSGGLDSTALLQLLREFSHLDLHALTVILPGQSQQEQAEAAKTAARHQIKHTKVAFSLPELGQHLANFLEHSDLPGTDGLNTWLAANLAREAGLSMAFSGLGGDELFAGYNRFQQARKLLRLQKFLRRHRFLRQLCRTTAAMLKNQAAMQKLASLTTWPYSGYFLNRQIFSASARHSLLGITAKTFVGDWSSIAFQTLDRHANSWGDDDINRISYLELNTYLRSTLLRDTAQCSHRSGVTIAMPFLDHRLVELMLTIPGHLKINDHFHKPLLLQAAGLEPRLAQLPKRGFTLPMEQLLRGSWQERVADTILAQNSLLPQKELAKTWQNFQQQKLPWVRVWALFVLLHWLKQHQMI